MKKQRQRATLSKQERYRVKREALNMMSECKASPGHVKTVYEERILVHEVGVEHLENRDATRPKVVRRIAFRTGTSVKAVEKALVHFEAGTFNEKSEKRVHFCIVSTNWLCNKYDFYYLIVPFGCYSSQAVLWLLYFQNYCTHV